MNSEDDFNAFRRHHRDPRNVAFHAFCGFASLSLLFSLVGVQFLIGYGALVTWSFRRHAAAAIAATAAVALGMAGLKMLGSPVAPRALGVVAFYLLPEVSHWLTGEKALLTKDSLTPRSVAGNFLMLLPYSIACAHRTPNQR
jgi:hypothetical protein